MTTDEIRGPIHSDDVPWEPWSEGTRFGSRARKLSKVAGAKHVGVLIEELPPGKQSCPFHYHMLEEEHLYVLEGSATLRLGDATHVIASGDYVCFPAGQRAGHCLVNHTDAPFRFLMIGEKNPHEVCVYPDSGKVAVDALGVILDLAATRDYWTGEKANEP